MRRKRLLVLWASSILLLSCVLLRSYWMSKTPMTSQDIGFVVEAGESQANLKLWHNYYDNKEYLFLPAFCGDKQSAEISARIYTDRSALLKWDGIDVSGGEALTGLPAGEHILQAGGTELSVVVMHSSKVPALFVTTSSGSLSYIEAEKGNGEAGLYEMVSADGKVVAAGQIRKLKSRGNSTFLEDKKPYQMTLTEGADLLGTGIQEKYILLANRQDQSLLRDRIMYDMAGDMGLAYSPVSTFLDLYVNGEYRGSYQLSEKVETGQGRIAIDTETKRRETGFLITFEYGFEDRLAETEYYFTTKNGQNVAIKRPANPTQEQMEYIAGTFQTIEDEIRQGVIDENKIDITSLARKYLIEEIGKNLDAMYTSQYFYQDAVKWPEDDTMEDDAAEDTAGISCAEGGDRAVKMYAGPVWDYDKTLGNPLIENTRPVNFQEPRGIFAASKQKDASWWYDLYEIPAFREKIIEEYEKVAVPAIERMLEERIDGYREEIWDSACMDFMRWDTFEDFKYEEELEFAVEYGGEIERIKEFLRLRKEFLDDIWLEGRKYDLITCDPGEGTMYVTTLDAIEGRPINEPRDPKREGYRFDHWVRKDTGEIYDFTEAYDGIPFTLEAVYVEDHGD